MASHNNNHPFPNDNHPFPFMRYQDHPSFSTSSQPNISTSYLGQYPMVQEQTSLGQNPFPFMRYQDHPSSSSSSSSQPNISKSYFGQNPKVQEQSSLGQNPKVQEQSSLGKNPKVEEQEEILNYGVLLPSGKAQLCEPVQEQDFLSYGQNPNVQKQDFLNYSQNPNVQEQDFLNYGQNPNVQEQETINYGQNPNVQGQETLNYGVLPSNHYVNQNQQSYYSAVDRLGHAMGGLRLSNTPPLSQTRMSFYDYDYQREMLMNRVISEFKVRKTNMPNTFNYHSSIGNNNGPSGTVPQNNGTFGFGQPYSVWSTQYPCPPSVLVSPENYKGRMVSMAKDECEFHSLQNMIHQGIPTELETIFSELKNHLHELMIHPVGNRVIQKFIQTIANTPRGSYYLNNIFKSISLDAHELKHLCTNQYGTLAIQKILEYMRTDEQICTVISSLTSITVALMKNTNGGYVIQQCLKLYPPKYQKIIMDEVAINCKAVLKDKCGCSIIQMCLPQVHMEAKKLLILKIVAHAVDLAEDQYGNYVLQFVIKMKMTLPRVNSMNLPPVNSMTLPPVNSMTLPPVNSLITSELRDRYDRLSMSKHASNVVEDLLRFSEAEDVACIVQEIMFSPTFLDVLQDPFGNYVAQTALECTKGPIHGELRHRILSKQEHLRSHLYGKRVLTFIKGHKLQI